MGKIIERAKGWGSPSLVISLNNIKDVCKIYQNNEEQCPFYEKHAGCLFRGRSPREW